MVENLNISTLDLDRRFSPNGFHNLDVEISNRDFRSVQIRDRQFNLVQAKLKLEPRREWVDHHHNRRCQGDLKAVFLDAVAGVGEDVVVQHLTQPTVLFPRHCQLNL